MKHAGPWLTIYSLWSRECKRFYRQRSRVIGALASPLVFWILIGAGLGRSFQAQAGPETVGYLEYFFPGTVLLVLLFTAIFSTISLIEDKREGFLQSVLVAPVPRASVAMGKILGGMTLAALQGLLFLVAAPFVGFTPGVWGWVLTVAVLFLNGFMMSSLGFVLAWRMQSVQGFHAVMNLVLMPLWLLSGALFPGDGAPQWLSAAIRFNPLTYGLAALRHALEGGHSLMNSLPPLGLSLMIVLATSVLLFGLCVLTASRRSEKDLPQ